jgi:ribonuclease-3
LNSHPASDGVFGGHSFRDPALLTEALTHPSALKRGRNDAAGDYERLEFLGDRVLGLVIATLIHSEFPKANAGDIAKRYNELVRRETLAEVALKIGLDQMIIMSDGEAQTGGRAKPAILADVCEALIGALYLDGGLEAAETLVLPQWQARVAGLKRAPQDPKMAIQEWAHANGMEPPAYDVISRDGPDHAPLFTIRAQLTAGEATAAGTSKKDAERQAAAKLLEIVRDGND